MQGYGPETYGERIAEVYDDLFYPSTNSEDTVEFLAELAAGGPVLELAIGTGRIALPLAARRIEVHGIDASEAMVAKLRGKPGGEGIPVTIGDFADVGVAGRYRLVAIVFNTLWALLTQEDLVRCVQNVADHLTEDGAFVTEMYVPDPARFDRGQRIHVRNVESPTRPPARLRPSRGSCPAGRRPSPVARSRDPRGHGSGGRAHRDRFRCYRPARHLRDRTRLARHTGRARHRARGSARGSGRCARAGGRGRRSSVLDRMGEDDQRHLRSPRRSGTTCDYRPHRRRGARGRQPTGVRLIATACRCSRSWTCSTSSESFADGSPHSVPPPRPAAPRPDAPRPRAGGSDRLESREPATRTFHQLLIDCEGDRTLRAVPVGMLQEANARVLIGPT